MNRRGFLGLVGAAVVAPLVPLPELDVGRRIFLPPRGGWRMSLGVIEFPTLTPAMIARECLRVLHVNAVFIAHIDREYDDTFARVTLRTENRIRIGDRITIQGLTP